MIKFLMMCCLMVCAVNASEGEWTEVEVVGGRQLALARCVGDCSSRVDSDSNLLATEELKRCVTELRSSRIRIISVERIDGVPDDALRRILKVCTEQKNFEKSFNKSILLRDFENFDKCLVGVSEGRYESLSHIEECLNACVQRMCDTTRVLAKELGR